MNEVHERINSKDGGAVEVDVFDHADNQLFLEVIDTTTFSGGPKRAVVILNRKKAGKLLAALTQALA